METVLLGSSNSAIVEFMIPEEGSYIVVDHHFANAFQGAVGISADRFETRLVVFIFLFVHILQGDIDVLLGEIAQSHLAAKTPQRGMRERVLRMPARSRHAPANAAHQATSSWRTSPCPASRK